MHLPFLDIALTALLGLVACGWLIVATQLSLGMRRLPRLTSVRPLADAELPSVSVLVSARDEAEKMPAALRSMLALDYPGYEVVAVDDRSRDATPEILREISAGCKLLKTIRVDELPPGWLGKPHGLQTAYEHSRGEWLVFTDADVHFHPQLLRGAVSLALKRGLDHLSIFPLMDMSGFWEKTFLSYFLLGGFIFTRAWNVPNQKSGAYAGVGAFQLLRRSVYEAIGTHRRLALEVVDDMALGRLVKAAGFTSGVALPEGLLRLRWHSGVGNIVRGTEKNLFAAAQFRWHIAAAQIGFILLVSVVPFLALLLARGWAEVLAGVSAACAVLLQARNARLGRLSPLYGLMHPFGALLLCFMSARSAFLTMRQRGIYWRGTFYPLEALRRGAV
ncbi:MAG TPA: glycosyltransferase family 2 protein [Candidatus Acidoferrales bacterium]|nr:glycosyltransferase family 2 protein [Candidatus Acidoferrales bacterium]